MFFFRRRPEDREDFEAEARLLLLCRMVEARDGENRREADQTLVQATRWLTNHPDDNVILKTRGQLRTKFKPLH